MPLIERPWVDHAQGVLHATGNPLDVALSGKGFFAVNGPSGPLYTRNGNFRLAADGKLTSADGYPVRDSQGAPLTLQAARPLEISQRRHRDPGWRGRRQTGDRRFHQHRRALQTGQQLFSRHRPGGASHGCRPGPAWNRANWKPPIPGSAEGAVRLVSVMRQFEMLQKAVSLGAEMNKKAIEEVAKV